MAEIKRAKTPEQALNALMNLCAKSEKSTGDAHRLMMRWGVEAADRDRIVARLVEEKYIDNRRYADAFTREKLSLGGWGTYKIRAALRAKQIGEETISAALQQADKKVMSVKLEELLRRKMRTAKAKNSYDLRGKLLRYGTGRGFDYEMVSELIDKLIKESE